MIMKKIIILILILCTVKGLTAQNVGIGTTTPSFKLDVKNGSINTDSVYRIGGSTVLSVKGTENTFTGIGTGTATTSGSFNAASGFNALASNTTGNYNAAFGHKALFSSVGGSNSTAFGTSALLSNTFGSNNSAHGVNALYYNSTGSYNTGVGSHALYLNVLGSNNTAVGESALFSNNGYGNTALGSLSMYYNGNGYWNTAAGYSALQQNTGGNYNTAFGYEALFSNTTALSNTALGVWSLYFNTTGSYNTAGGDGALHKNISGWRNTALGARAMFGNETGNKNTAVGENSLSNTNASDFNTAVGYNAALKNMGWNNTIVGAEADATGSGFFNSIALGNIATINGSSQTRIGNSFTVSTGGYTGWTNISDGRYKKNVQEDVKGLDFILRLRPVTYHLDVTKLSEKLNEKRGREFTAQSKMAMVEKERQLLSGFVAQEVEQAANALGYDFSGVDRPANSNDFYGLRYAEFVVPLVKAVQEQQQMIDFLQKQVETPRAEIPIQIGKQQQQLNEMKKEIDLLKEQNKLLLQLLKNKN